MPVSERARASGEAMRRHQQQQRRDTGPWIVLRNSMLLFWVCMITVPFSWRLVCVALRQRFWFAAIKPPAHSYLSSHRVSIQIININSNYIKVKNRPAWTKTSPRRSDESTKWKKKFEVRDEIEEWQTNLWYSSDPKEKRAKPTIPIEPNWKNSFNVFALTNPLHPILISEREKYICLNWFFLLVRAQIHFGNYFPW